MNKKSIIISINLLLGVILFFVFIDPLWNSIKMLKMDIIKQEQETKNIETLLLNIQKLEQDYQEIGVDMNDIFLALPNEKDIPYLINQFELLASNNGLLLESMNFDEEINRKDKNAVSIGIARAGQSDKLLSEFPYLSFEIVLNGSYSGLKSYLESLGNNIRLMDVRTIGFKKYEAESSVFKFTLGVLVYYQ